MHERVRRAVVTACALLLGGAGPLSGSPPEDATEVAGLVGVVRDASGFPIAQARVSVSSVPESVRTDAEGRFHLAVPPAPEAEIRIEAAGFESLRRTVAVEGVVEVELQLTPRALSEEVTVHATRTDTRLSDTPLSVVILSTGDLEGSAAPVLDDVLRQVPGFTLFRRSGSRTANPTSQGASLRGIGASGASRAVVLDDGVPLNDPFGGWVPWGRVPLLALDRVEVLRGGASDLHGNAALAGVVDLVRRPVEGPMLLAEGALGQQGTGSGTLVGGARRGPWGAAAAAERLVTDGYVIVDPSARGPIDQPAGSRHTAVDVRLERALGDADSRSSLVFVRGAWFDESRANGTPYQANDTRLRQLQLGFDRRGARGSVGLRAYGTDQTYHQTFSAVSEDRTRETPSRAQEVPSTAFGVSLQGTRAAGSVALLGGLQASQVRGTSDETVFTPGGTLDTSAGGRQRTASGFAQVAWHPAQRVSLTTGLRLDAWRNGDAARTNAGVTTALAEREQTAWSPRLGVTWQAASSLAVTGSAYRSFRAPTLNELYRPFRVGNVLTQANETLEAERLTGFEAGARWARGPASLRGTLFWMTVDDPIANVTLTVTPALTTQQRRNLGRSRSRGAEVDAEARLSSGLSLSAGYLFADARVVENPADPLLVGLRTPQVPRHQASAQARFASARFTTALLARWSAMQFEDDRNRIALAGFATLDALLSVSIGSRLDLLAAVENVTDNRYEVGRTPVPTIGPPRTGRVALRLEVPGR